MAPLHGTPQRLTILPVHRSTSQSTNVPETVSQEAGASQCSQFVSSLLSQSPPIEETPQEDSLPASTPSGVPQEDDIDEDVYESVAPASVHEIKPCYISAGR